MKYTGIFSLGTAALLLAGMSSRAADIVVKTDHNRPDESRRQFKFKETPPPATNSSNVALKAKITIVSGAPDPKSGPLTKLNDGKLPIEQDLPGENFYFNEGTKGGRIQMDLGSVINIKEIITYSWHPNSRGPQRYTLYASDGKAKEFNALPKDVDPVTCGWVLITKNKVDMVPPNINDAGGQYAATISDSKSTVGKYRYLLFDIERTEAKDGYGNTFYSEIAVIKK